MMSNKHIGWVFLFILSVVGCGRGVEEGQLLSVRIAGVESSTSDSVAWYLFTYGATEVTVDTLPIAKGGHIKWQKYFDRDTLDLMLLMDEDVALVAPITADSVDIVFRLKNGELDLKGVPDADMIQNWNALRATCSDDVTGEMMSFLEEHSYHRLVPLFAVDLMQRFPRSSCYNELRDLAVQGVGRHRQFMEVLGLTSVESFPTRGYFSLPIENPWGDTESNRGRSVKEMMGKKPMMLVSVLQLATLDSTQVAQEWKFIEQLDSMGIPSYHILPFTDQLPKEWKGKRKLGEGSTWRYFLLDTAGQAVGMVDHLGVQHLPIYMLVDSLQQVWRTWREKEEVLKFMESM